MGCVQEVDWFFSRISGNSQTKFDFSHAPYQATENEKNTEGGGVETGDLDEILGCQQLVISLLCTVCSDDRRCTETRGVGRVGISTGQT